MSRTAPFSVAFNGPVDRFVVTSNLGSGQIIVITQSGDVWGHNLAGNANAVGQGFKFEGARVAFNGPVDRFVVTKDDRIFVITQSGDVWGHKFNGSKIDPSFKYGGAKVAINGPVDRFVVASGLKNDDRMFVITQSGDVWSHAITSNSIGPGIKCGGAKVAINGPVDRFVVTMGSRMIVVREDGDVWGHEVDPGGVINNTIGPAFKFDGAKVAINGAMDRFVVTSDNRLIVIRGDGDVWGHNVIGKTIGPPFPMNFRLMHFTFANDITAVLRDRLIERHRFALRRVMLCNSLSAEEKRRLIDVAYDRPIHHKAFVDEIDLGRADRNRGELSVNFQLLFPLGDEEIAQTIIHEMMHMAHYCHPEERHDPPAGTPCTSPPFDCPGDNGPYYGTPPLRAELCIAGDQSLHGRLERKAVNKGCTSDGQDVATIYVESSVTPRSRRPAYR
ncbi:hypothetical protein [Nonomuraea sp. NPDC003709]|uniref:hypothetical protein n=1 Tax=Nonomuraea sp. NPDC003709 TaxID=3154450 RepID=UPI0033A06ECD